MMNSRSLSDARFVNAALLMIAFILLSVALSHTRTLAVPFVVAVFIYYLLTPPIIILRTRFGLPRMTAIIITLIGALGLSVLFAYFISSSIGNLIASFDLYQKRVLSLLPLIIKQINSFGLNLDVEGIRSKVLELPFFSYIRGAAGAVVHFVSMATLVGIYVVFMLTGSKFEVKKSSFWTEVNTKIRKYVLTKLITSTGAGVLVGIILASFGVDFPVMFGTLTLILNFIPTLGSIVATLLPLPVAILEFNEPYMIVAVIALPGFIQFCLGFVEPRILGKSLNLHPIAVLLSLIFWGMIWGITGAFLAVPITAVLKIILERFETTEKVGKMLSGEIPDIEMKNTD